MVRTVSSAGVRSSVEQDDGTRASASWPDDGNAGRPPFDAGDGPARQHDELAAREHEAPLPVVAARAGRARGARALDDAAADHEEADGQGEEHHAGDDADGRRPRHGEQHAEDHRDDEPDEEGPLLEARTPSEASALTWTSLSTTVSGGRGASAHPPSGTAASVKGAPGDVDDLAGDEAGLLGHQERDGGGDVLGLADPPDRDLLRGVRR